MADNRPDDAGTQPQEGEFRGSAQMGTAVISGATFTNKSVTYYDVNGVAIVEGDIAIGATEQVRQATDAARQAAGADPNIAFGVGITGSQFRWPNCQIPYQIDPNLPNQQRVTDAIAHWESNTPFRFPLRTNANAGQYPNYVWFTDGGGCWSSVGMQGGQQTISLGTGCSAGNAIHEIGHSVGLWHEQSREDRDLFVTINWQNIQAGMAAQFNQHITDGDDLGSYDYGSIMHYPRDAFSSNGQDTITPTDPNAQIGQRTALSAGDLAAVRAMYAGCYVKQPWTEPGGFKKMADDGPRVKKIVDDRPNFKKLADDPGPGIKKLTDDQRFKKIRDDIPNLKQLRDPKGPFDPGPIKAGLDPISQPGPGAVIQPGVLQPGGLQPFAMATAHHAPGAAGMGTGQGADVGSSDYLTSLQQQLLDLQAAIAQAQAAAAQANADAARLQQASDQLAAAYADAIAGMGSGQG